MRTGKFSKKPGKKGQAIYSHLALFLWGSKDFRPQWHPNYTGQKGAYHHLGISGGILRMCPVAHRPGSAQKEDCRYSDYSTLVGAGKQLQYHQRGTDMQKLVRAIKWSNNESHLYVVHRTNPNETRQRGLWVFKGLQEHPGNQETLSSFFNSFWSHSHI